MFRTGRSPRLQCWRRAIAAASGFSSRRSNRSTEGNSNRSSIQSLRRNASAPAPRAESRWAADIRDIARKLAVCGLGISSSLPAKKPRGNRRTNASRAAFSAEGLFSPFSNAEIERRLMPASSASRILFRPRRFRARLRRAGLNMAYAVFFRRFTSTSRSGPKSGVTSVTIGSSGVAGRMIRSFHASGRPSSPIDAGRDNSARSSRSSVWKSRSHVTLPLSSCTVAGGRIPGS